MRLVDRYKLIGETCSLCQGEAMLCTCTVIATTASRITTVRTAV